MFLFCRGICPSVSAESVGWLDHEIERVGHNASDVAAADLDGDGDEDLAVIFDDSFNARKGLYWFENTTGDGSEWALHTISDPHFDMRTLAVGDIDGDGTTDLVVADHDVDRVTWWANVAGDGSVWNRNLIASSDAGPLALSDIDADGDLDVVGSGGEGARLALWENEFGDGSAWIEHVVDTDLTPELLDVVDIDGDGRLDVLAYSGLDRVAWWKGLGGDLTSWQRNDAFLEENGVTVLQGVDIDGDGDIDIARVVPLADPAIAWWENAHADGQLWIEHVVFEGARSLRDGYAEDVDLDGDIDLVTGGSAEISWWENDPGAPWVERALAVDPGWGGVSLTRGDFDGDGRKDLATGNTSGSAWWSNETCFELRTTHVGFGADPLAIALANGTFDGGDRVIDDKLELPVDASTGDIDGDGDLDLVVATEGDGALHWLKNPSGQGSTWSRQTIVETLSPPTATVAADLDGDADLDVLVAIAGDSTIAWWENRDGSGADWGGHLVSDDILGASVAAAADLDGDGDLDILGTAEDTGGLAWYENFDGLGTVWNEQVLDAAFAGASSVLAADLDGDGDLDVVATAPLIDEVAWWENEVGDGSSWTRATLDSAFEGATSAIAADVDGDGDQDVVAVAEEFEAINWLENVAGDGSSWVKRQVGFEREVRTVFSGDIDQDGDIDLLTSSTFFEFELAWWENEDGEGGAWSQRRVLFVFSDTSGIGLADFDLDGDLDAYAALPERGEISWWENSYRSMCSGGDHLPGARIALEAEPDLGWQVSGWSGTDDDASSAAENLVTMPATDHEASVTYSEIAPALVVSGDCPGETTIRVESATGNASIVLLGADELTPSSVPAGKPCAGLPIELGAPTVLTVFTTGPDGSQTIRPIVSVDRCGTFLQAVDLSACRATNISAVPTAER